MEVKTKETGAFKISGISNLHGPRCQLCMDDEHPSRGNFKSHFHQPSSLPVQRKHFGNCHEKFKTQCNISDHFFVLTCMQHNRERTFVCVYYIIPLYLQIKTCF